MITDNEKLFEALDKIGHVNRGSSFMMLPEDKEDERPFLLHHLKKQVGVLIKNYVKDPANAERVEYYRLEE